MNMKILTDKQIYKFTPDTSSKNDDMYMKILNADFMLRLMLDKKLIPIRKINRITFRLSSTPTYNPRWKSSADTEKCDIPFEMIYSGAHLVIDTSGSSGICNTCVFDEGECPGSPVINLGFWDELCCDCILGPGWVFNIKSN